MERYSSGCEELCHYPDNNGDWVKHSDILRLTAAASNLLKKHRLGAISEADVRWMEKELQEVKP